MYIYEELVKSAISARLHKKEAELVHLIWLSVSILMIKISFISENRINTIHIIIKYKK